MREITYKKEKFYRCMDVDKVVIFFSLPQKQEHKMCQLPKSFQVSRKRNSTHTKKTFLLSRWAKWDEQVKTHPHRFLAPLVSLHPIYLSPAFALLTPLRRKTQTHSTRKDSARRRARRIDPPKPSAPPEKGVPSGRVTSSLGNGDDVGARQARSRHQALHALPGEARGRRGCAAWAGRR